IELTAIEPGYTEATAPFEKMHQQQDGWVHGGLTATMADIVSGFAAYTLVPENHRVVTADIRTSYMRPGIGHTIWAKGWVEKPGSNFFFCEAEVYMINYENEKVLIAKSSSTMAMIKPKA
ncbi:MAG: PaaI family thioesterase, partial [Bacteroidetes bacterium]|nr:PaaI family thioesterase [Bacteroidota bacterium]